MKLQRLAKQFTDLVERELRKKLLITANVPTDHSMLTYESFTELFIEWGVTTGKTIIRYETEMMGSSKTIYVKLGRVIFAVLHNYDANSDGLNRFIMTVPLYADVEKGGYILVGAQEVPLDIVADACEKFTDILVELHNSSL